MADRPFSKPGEYKPTLKQYGSEATRQRRQTEDVAAGTTKAETASPFDGYRRGGMIKQTPPRLTPLMGRASPAGSHNFGGLNKGVDMPNQSSAPDEAPLGSMPYKPRPTRTANFCKGGKVISSRSA